MARPLTLGLAFVHILNPPVGFFRPGPIFRHVTWHALFNLLDNDEVKFAAINNFAPHPAPEHGTWLLAHQHPRRPRCDERPKVSCRDRGA